MLSNKDIIIEHVLVKCQVLIIYDNDNENEIVYFDINNKIKNIEQKQLFE